MIVDLPEETRGIVLAMAADKQGVVGPSIGVVPQEMTPDPEPDNRIRYGMRQGVIR